MRSFLDPYQELANAIVIQAADDYRTVLRTLKKNPYNKATNATRKSIENFFHSGWYGTLTQLNPKLLISRIYEEVFS